MASKRNLDGSTVNFEASVPHGIVSALAIEQYKTYLAELKNSI